MGGWTSRHRCHLSSVLTPYPVAFFTKEIGPIFRGPSRASDLFLGFPHRGSSIVFVRCFTLSAGESNVATPFVTSHSGPIAGKGVMGITQSSVLHLADPVSHLFSSSAYTSHKRKCVPLLDQFQVPDGKQMEKVYQKTSRSLGYQLPPGNLR